MVQPHTVIEQNKTDPLYPWVKRGIFTGVTKFDQVYKLINNSGKQFYADLPGIYNDLHNFMRILNRFEFGPDDIETLMNQKFKDLANMLLKIDRLLKSNPLETTLVFSCYASHGMIMDGRQVVLVNEYAQKNGFYRVFAAEENLRNIAQKYSNAYLVTIFACCREIHLISQHSKGISLKQFLEIEQEKKVRAKCAFEKL